MTDQPAYTEHRADPSGLRQRPGERLRSGNFVYPTYPFTPPPELREHRVGHHPVVIIGGGLAGLTAAVDLGVRGIPCVLLDDNNTVSLGSRSIAQGKRTMEIATRLGISEKMLPIGISWSKGNTLIQDKLLYSFDLLPDGHEKYQAFLCLPQYYVEEILVERAKDFPHVDIRWSNRVVGLKNGTKSAEIDVETPEGNYKLEADWVIACDGVRSTVRKNSRRGVRGRQVRREFRHLRCQDGVQVSAAADVLVRSDLRQEQYFADASAAGFDLAGGLATRAG